MKQEKKTGEGNREADRRYRKGVNETVQNTSASERAENARDVDDEELKKSRQAEEKGRSRARH